MAEPKNRQQEQMKKILEKFNNKEFKKCYDMIKQQIKDFTITLDLLLIKMKCEQNLTKFEEALKSANMILFIQPNNFECHTAKLTILKNLNRYNLLSDCLLATKTLFPNHNII